LHSDTPDYWALAELVGPNANAGTWVAVSEHIADKARKLNPAADIRIIPYGVPVEARNARWNNSVFRIAYCGRMLEEQKRIKLVTTTLIECCRMSSNIEAVMIGDGPERDAMEHRIEKEGLSERIRFTGRLAGANLQNTLSSCQGILLMSDYEGLPVALLEGMAQGLVPMARSMQSGIPELVIPNQTGLILPDTPRNAAEPIVKLARDPVAWQGMSECAYALVREKYSQRTCLEQWLSLIQELSQRSTASYPIEIPSRIKLPPSDRRLRAHDWRRLTFLQKIGFQLKRLVRRIKIPN
jgi:glycosyltransferase involved in cell wall biosynthesis